MKQADDGTVLAYECYSRTEGFVVGSYFLLKPNKGLGILLDSIGDIEPRVVTVIGAGQQEQRQLKKLLLVALM